MQLKTLIHEDLRMFDTLVLKPEFIFFRGCVYFTMQVIHVEDLLKQTMQWCFSR